MPTIWERLIHTGGDGSTLGTYDTPFGRLSGLICGENINSLARTALLLEGEVIHVASWPAFGTKGYERQFHTIGTSCFLGPMALYWVDIESWCLRSGSA